MNDKQLATVYRDRERLHAELCRIAELASRWARVSRPGRFRVLADMANEALASCERTIRVPVLTRRLDKFPAGSVIPCVAYWLGDGDYRCVTVGRGGDVMAACREAYQANSVIEKHEDPKLYRTNLSTALGEVVNVMVLVEYVGTPTGNRPEAMSQGSQVLDDEHPPAMV